MQRTFLQLLQPAIQLMPNVSNPTYQINVRTKTIYTAITLFIYLLCCQIPLYGVLRSQGSDPFYWMRVILASNRGTLMQLGMSPVITASWILQLMVGTGMIKADMNTQKDRQLYEGAQKCIISQQVLSLILSFGQALAYILSGNYGTIDQIGVGNAMIILFQLTFAGVLVILLDQMLQKGYGLGSGISLFIAANLCQHIFWRSFSPITIKTQFGTQFQGSLISLIHFMITKPNKTSAVYQAFFRSTAPNLSNLLATILVFFIVIYLQGFKVNLALINNKYRGVQKQFPIKLFYTSNISIIFQTAFVSNVYFLSQILDRKFKGNFIIRIIGVWQQIQGQSKPIGGIAYYISPPENLSAFFTQPLHSFTYTLFVMLSCAFFAKFWLQITKESPPEIAKRFKEQGLCIAGQTDRSVLQILNRHIPIAASCGGMIIGILTIFSDLVGAIGSGTGILLSVSIIYGYYQKIVNDKKDQSITF